MPAVASRSGSRRWAVELGALAVEFERLYVKFDGTPIQPETASRPALAGRLLGALGAAVDGAARLRSAVALVSRVALAISASRIGLIAPDPSMEFS